ncbi:MAG: leucine-rich repeat protein [Clostridia bacterium]|nr:leucine-rich repeat protein [Clostridia bacterium]MBQ7102287.1 leucine-rich repeat protein [Clostridia bacterium]
MKAIKRTAAILLSILLVLTALPLIASAEYVTSGDYTFYTEDGGAVIHKYNGNEMQVIVPDKLDGIPVTAIGSFSFSSYLAGTTDGAEASKLKSITLPATLLKIGDNAFRDCKELQTVTFTGNTETIAEKAFSGCVKLESINVPETVSVIGKKAFEGCEMLSEFTVPRKLRELSADMLPPEVSVVYYNAEVCTFTDLEAQIYNYGGQTLGYISPFVSAGVDRVIIGDTVKRIPDYFMYMFENINKLTLPDSVTDIGKAAFRYSSLSAITFSKNLISIDDEAFYGTGVIPSGNTFPNSLRMIGKEAFRGCERMTEITIPDSVVLIEERAFACCYALKSVRMSSNVSHLPNSVFSMCGDLESFLWDAEVKLIDSWAFNSCSSLYEFDFTGVEKLCESSFRYSGIELLMLGDESDVEAVEAYSFKNCANLEALSIGGSVSQIKSEAFAQCTSLETAVISNSVSSIAVDAFDGCGELTIFCMENSYAHSYAVENSIPVTTLVIDPIPNQTYTGKKIEPEISVRASGNVLVENTDYSVRFLNNINVGTARVTVDGKGIYKVLSSVANFTIITKNISAVSVAPLVEQSYTGLPVTPSLTLTDGSNILKENTDYTVTYSDNTDIGTAKATVKGISNYSGSVTVEFTITQQTFFEKLWGGLSSFFNAVIAWLTALFAPNTINN